MTNAEALPNASSSLSAATGRRIESMAALVSGEVWAGTSFIPAGGVVEDAKAERSAEAVESAAKAAGAADASELAEATEVAGASVDAEPPAETGEAL